MAEPIIELNKVNFWYNKDKPSETWALKDINLTINRGEYAAFFGPSGSGKTSLLYLISGIEKSQAGELKINGRDIANFTSQELAIYRQVGVGMIFQQFNLIPTLSVANNVALPMAFLGISADRRRKRAMELLDRLGISNLAERLPYELSGGQQQRVGIARALANNPPILIADEPLGNLDSENSQKVLEFLKELNEKDNRTVIMVTHEAWSLRDAKKIFYIKDGQVVKTETPTPKTLRKSITKHMFGQIDQQAEPNEVAAKSLSSMFLRGFSREEMERFQKLIRDRLDRKITAQQFLWELDRPYKEGGIGLWFQKASKISLFVEDLIQEKAKLDEIHKIFETNPENPPYEEMMLIRKWLLQGYKGTLDYLQIERLDEIIRERIVNIIDYESFQKVLNLPKSKMGVGIPLRSSQRMAEKLELALSSKQLPAGQVD